MTLITSSVPLNTFYSRNDNLTQNNSSNTTSTSSQALSWLQYQPATVSTTSAPSLRTNINNKYRTLASIQAQSLQQHLHLLNNDNCLSPISPASIKPNLLDTQSTLSTINATSTTSIAPIEKEKTSSITAALQAMDASHGTCFLTWIHNPANLDYISLRLRPLCLEYPLVDVANVLRWIGADWSSTDCKALFRAVTSNWDQSKRRILAFLLIRDEEMRQKAKSKLVEFAQKSRKSTQLRTSGSSSSITPQQQHIQHQRIQPSVHYQQRMQQQQQSKQVQSVSVGASVSIAPISSGIHNSINNADSWRGGVNMTALENIAAASLITGIDMTPLSASSILSSSTSGLGSDTCASTTTATTTTTTTTTNLYSRRFSPY
ncbi:hypothetical protein FBU30_000602 [Linnemannia zychae]|nr:hypothetical protein FBU30_000602 [Linnemannia zychae]